jgi:CBS-domain-containing membrane protein
MMKFVLQGVMMKTVMVIALVLMLNIAQAQIYKCEGAKGKVVYQDKECTSSSKQSEVSVQEFDPEKTLEAQEKLNRELRQREELEAARAEQEMKERKIMAIEAQARSNEDLANAARENALAIEKNTEAVQYGNQRSNVYYYNPPRHRPGHEKPIAKPYNKRGGAKATISTK